MTDNKKMAIALALFVLAGSVDSILRAIGL